MEVDASDIWGRSPSPEPVDEIAQQDDEPEPAEPVAAAEEPATAAEPKGASAAAATMDDEDVAAALENGSDSEQEQQGEDEGGDKPKKERKEKKRKREKKKKKKSKKAKKKKKKKRRSTSSDDDDVSESEEESADDSLARQYEAPVAVEEPEPGPRPLPKMAHVSYGGALQPGEGDAMAAYVQAGKRIPRRCAPTEPTPRIPTWRTLFSLGANLVPPRLPLLPLIRSFFFLLLCSSLLDGIDCVPHGRAEVRSASTPMRSQALRTSVTS